MHVLFNVLVVVRRRLVGPPKDFQGGPDACVHLTAFSKCSNLHKRSANVMGRATVRATGRAGRAAGHATGGPIFGASPHSDTFFPFGF